MNVGLVNANSQVQLPLSHNNYALAWQIAK